MLDNIRYQQQIILSEVGTLGQEKIAKSKVLCIGVGGLGAACLYYLVAAGVGTITIVDGDRVELSNLHRQIIFTTKDIGRLKVHAAKQRLQELNPNIIVKAIAEKLNSTNALSIAYGQDIIIDATDNFATTFLINDLAVILGIPMIYAAVTKFNAQLAVFWAQKSTCYRCLYPDYPQTIIGDCGEGGVLGALVGMLGTMQAIESIKCLLNMDTLMIGKLMKIDAKSMDIKKFSVNKNPACPVCSFATQQIKLRDYNPLAACNLFAIDALPKNKPYILVDVRKHEEWQINHLNKAINIPLTNLMPKNVAYHLPQDKKAYYILYCQTDRRSQQALAIFQQHGFTQTKYLRGGLSKHK